MIPATLPVEMVMPTAIVASAGIGGLLFGCCVAYASRLALRRRTLAEPCCRRCSMTIAPVDGRLPERCSECGAELAAPAAVLWVKGRSLALAKSVVLAVGLVFAGLGALVAGIGMRDALQAAAREDLASALEATLARCERPGVEGARALAELVERMSSDGLSVVETIAFDRWLSSVDPEVVAFGGPRAEGASIDWLRAADFVELVIVAIEQECTSIWTARDAIGRVLPFPAIEAPRRVRPGASYAIVTDAGLPGVSLAVQDGELLIDGTRVDWNPADRRVGDGQHVRTLRAPETVGRYRMHRAWKTDVIAGTLSMPPRKDAAADGLPRSAEEEWTLEVADGPESIEVTQDPSRDPFLADGSAMLVEMMSGERSTWIRWRGWPSGSTTPVGSWSIDVGAGDATSGARWIPLHGEDAFAAPAVAVVEGDPFVGRERIRVRFTPVAAPELPAEGGPIRRSAAGAFGLERTYELVRFSETSWPSARRERTYRLAPAARE
jgi:hypothetical protein